VWLLCGSISESSVIEGFAQALRSLIEHPNEVRRLSEGACRRAEEFSWDHVAALVDRAYEAAGRRQVRSRVG